MRAVLLRLRELVAHEPVVVRSLIGLVVAGALVWGVDIADLGERIAQTVEIVAAIVALLGLTWARQGAVAAKEVVAVVEPDGTTVAGPASPLPDGTPVTPGLTDGERDALTATAWLVPEGHPGRDAIASFLDQARHLQATDLDLD